MMELPATGPARRAPTRIRPMIGPVISLLLLATGCGGEVPDDGAGAHRLVVEPTLRIGDVDGGVNLSAVLGMATGPDGRLYVTDWLTPHVLVFDERGNLVDSIGRAGVGPGEFNRAGRLGFVGDTLWATTQGHLNLFATDGRVRGMAGRQGVLEGGAIRTYPVAYVTDGRVLAEAHESTDRVASGAAEMMLVLATDAGGAVLDTVAVARQPRTLVQLRDGDQGMGVFSSRAFDGPTVAYSPVGTSLVVIGRTVDDDRSGRLEAWWIGTDGDTVAYRSVPFEPTFFTDADRDSLVEDFARRMASQDRTLARSRVIAEEQLVFPPFVPPWRDAVVGSDDRLWLLREIVGDSARWEAWERDTDARAEAWLPADLTLRYAAVDHLWGARPGAFDVPCLWRYRIGETR